MLRTPENSSSGPIGCYIDDSGVRMVQMRITDGEVSLAKASAMLNGGGRGKGWPEGACNALRQAWREGAFTHRDVVCCMPRDQATYRRLRLPVMPDTDVESAVRWRLAKELSRPRDELCTAHYDVGEMCGASKRYREVIGVAAELNHVNLLVDTLNKAGLILTAIDTHASALGRCINGCKDQDSPCIVLEIDRSQTMLFAFSQGVPSFVGSTPRGLEHIVQAAEQKSGIPDAQLRLWSLIFTHSIHDHGASAPDDELERLLRDSCVGYAREMTHEILLCSHYLSEFASGELQPRVGCVLGAGRLNDCIARVISGASDIDCRLVDELLLPPLRGLTQQVGTGVSIDAWIPSLGLSLYGVEEDAGRAVA